ncbi:peptidase S16 lon domain protein [Chthoniobacter flavus Ellin428]|uniref:Peptidase S16 lon domain protein n=2 Tax=Chthoniobacter flavus TaxID=191863 RepID=B4D8Y2_9BACT|nr:peptidase S16 lon domain protein [Chthoniobacter flavus Ellin428]TCO86206.1 ATP-dependent Lon protease [Chthoniobacter flavus]
MVLPGAQLYPHVPLPLYIFEPRYRQMLAWSLEADRMFCIASMKPGISEARATDDFYHVVGLGFVRACVGRDDGTSHLILQGLARMRIVGFLQDKPFRIAELRELTSTPPAAEENDLLRIQMLKESTKHFTGDAKMPENVEQEFGSIDDPAMMADMIAHACLQDSEQRQAILEELDVQKRVQLLLSYLRK